MKDIKQVLKERPNVNDYDLKPYGYIVALTNYADKLEKAINYSHCCTQLKDKVKLTFDEYTEKLYISNGFTYESKRTGKLADINEITERYRWYSKNL